MQRLLEPRLTTGITFVAVLMVMSLFVGRCDILGADDGWEMFATACISHTIALVFLGATVAMRDLVMQLLTHNKFVEPTTTGTTEWAGPDLISTMHFFSSVSSPGRTGGATIFIFIGTAMFSLFLYRVTLRSNLVVPIIGIIPGAAVSPISTFSALRTGILQSLSVWFAGSLTDIYRGQYEFLWLVVIVIAVVFVLSDRLTVAGLGEDIVTDVGLNYKRIMFPGMGLIATATGLATVVVDSLPFLGLIVLNTVSMFRGDDLRPSLLWVCLVGIGTVAIADLIGCVIITPFEISVSVILGILGAAIFVYLIAERRHA